MSRHPEMTEVVTKPYFSVITVCFNDFENLKKTYDSVRQQTCSDYEWIVVDGASGDGAAAWLADLDNEHLKWLSERDKGLYDAMNKGIGMASGRYLIFMNSGDLFAEADVLAKVKVRADSESTPALLYGDSVDFSFSGQSDLRKARSAKSYESAMFAQHQSIFFKNDGRLYKLKYRVSADYAYIGEAIMADPRSPVYLGFAVCKFLLGGLNEQKRFDALKEDLDIRLNVFGVYPVKAFMLYIAHFAHSVLKRLNPKLARVVRSTRNVDLAS